MLEIIKRELMLPLIIRKNIVARMQKYKSCLIGQAYNKIKENSEDVWWEFEELFVIAAKWGASKINHKDGNNISIETGKDSQDG